MEAVMRSIPRNAQQGVVLFIALIVLVAMSLAGIALMRSVDTGTIIAANLGFKQGTTSVGDLGVEAARTWLRTKGAATPADLYVDDTPNNYYATWQSSVRLIPTDSGTADYGWAGPDVATPAPPAGYSVRYVIHRLCDATGNPSSGPNCVKPGGSASSGSSSTKGAAAYGSFAIAAPTSALFRITVQVRGPRNSLSYVQATIY
jgi:type IV pilus assembly protein PilX